MDVMVACYKHWTDMIFSGEKPFEFRTKPIKRLYVGDKIFFYEPKKTGSGKVTGEAVVEKIIPLLFKQSPQQETFRYWAEHIKKDHSLVEAIDRIGRFRMSRYKDGYIYHFMFSKPMIEYIMANDELPPAFNSLQHRIAYPEIYQEMELARERITEYDDWMQKIGFWQEDGTSCYTVAYQLKNAVFFASADYQEIQDFLDQRGKPLQRPPQSYQYVL